MAIQEMNGNEIDQMAMQGNMANEQAMALIGGGSNEMS